MKKYLSVFLTVFFLGLFVIYYLQNKEDFSALRNISWYWIVIIAFLKILFIFVNGLFTKVSVNIFEKELNHKDSFYLAIISAVGNYFAPFQGGMGIRAIYLKQKLNLSYTNFISTLSGYFVIIFTVSSILGLISSFYISIHNETSSISLYALFITTLIIGFVLIRYNLSGKLFKVNLRNKLIQKLVKKVQEIIAGWDRISSNKTILLKLITINLLTFSVAAVIAYIEFRILGIDTISVPGIIIYIALSNLSTLISLTPGAIGIKEAIYLIFSSSLLISESEILQVAIIDRAIVFFVLAGMYFLLRLLNLWNNKQK